MGVFMKCYCWVCNSRLYEVGYAWLMLVSSHGNHPGHGLF